MTHTPPVYVYCAAYYNSRMFEKQGRSSSAADDGDDGGSSSGSGRGGSSSTGTMLVVTGAYDHKVRLWNGRTGDLLGVLGDQPHHHLDIHQSWVNVLVAHGKSRAQ